MAAVRTVLESLGYTKENIETASEINDSWFLCALNDGRLAYVDFVPGQKGVQGSYNEVSKFLTKAQYEARKSTSAAPVAAQPTAAVSTAPTNGAPVPSVSVVLPPPASAAQGIVS